MLYNLDNVYYFRHFSLVNYTNGSFFVNQINKIVLAIDVESEYINVNIKY